MTARVGEWVSVRRCVGAREGRLKEACIGRTAARPYDQLTTAERSRIDLMVRRDQASPTEALTTINKGRRKRKEREVTKSTAHRYVNGKTHRLGGASP